MVVGFLPFQSPPGEEDLERTAAAVTEGVHQRLREEAIPRISLISPSVARELGDSRRMPSEIGREIGADVVVVGGLRPESESRALLSAALIRVEDGRSLWAEELEVVRPTPVSGRDEMIRWLGNRLRRALQAARVPS